MPITDYFLAPDDATAGTVPAEGGPGAASLPVVEAKGMDPVVVMGNLESVLTGRPYGVVVGAPRQGHAVSGASDAVVVAVTDSLRDALAGASVDALGDAAARLAATAELAGSDPVEVTNFVHGLAGLARQADGRHLYCCWAL
ncbi:MAG: hypothetical protein SYR96_26710 [Actinomycetota bacterium]|nr:hypothetical protein [Actinomycetota bacterium]